MRTGWFRRAHIKTAPCYRLRLLLTHRRNLKRKFLDLENAIRHSLKAVRIRLNRVGRGGFAQAVRDAVAGDALISELIDAMLNARAARWKEYCRLHGLVVKLVAGHELCRRFMQTPGVGPIAALSFMTAIDDPSRFRRSRDVAAYFGLTSRHWQSGTSIDVQGAISKAGDADVRRALYEAASALLTRFKRRDKVKTRGLAVAKRSGHRKAVVAVARKLAVIMHAMWCDGTVYCGDQAVSGLDMISQFPAPRQQFVEAVDGMAVDHLLQDVPQIGVGLDVVQLARRDQRADHCPSMAAAVAAGEQVVLAAEGDGADCALDRIGIELNSAVVQEACQAMPPRERIADRLGKRAAAGDQAELCIEPDVQGIDDRLGEGPAFGKTVVRRLAADARLDGIELADPTQGFCCHGRRGGFGHIVELASRVAPTRRERDALLVGQLLEASVSVDMQDPLEGGQMCD